MSTADTELRMTALRLANEHSDAIEETVRRAEAYLMFLQSQAAPVVTTSSPDTQYPRTEFVKFVQVPAGSAGGWSSCKV